jgi:hypothetical protein
MKINQLFRKPIDVQTVIDIVKCFGLHGLNDRRPFCKGDLVELRTVQKINDMMPRIIDFYLPCKAQVYLHNLNEKRSVTVLKQVLRVSGYFLVSCERNVNTRKVIFYNINSELDDKVDPHTRFYKVKKVIEFF